MESSATTTRWSWTCSDRVWRTSSTSATASSPSRPSFSSPISSCVLFTRLVPRQKLTRCLRTDLPRRIHPLAQLHPPGHQARQLPHGNRQAWQPGQRDRLWTRQEIPRSQDAPSHPVQGEQEPHWNSEVHEYQHSSWSRCVLPLDCVAYRSC